jgi:hypothetical protein
MRLTYKHLALLAAEILMSCLLTVRIAHAEAEASEGTDKQSTQVEAAETNGKPAQAEQPAKADGQDKKKKVVKRSSNSKSDNGGPTKYEISDTELPAGSGIYLRIYDPARVAYKGFVNYDSVDLGTGGPLYPGDNAGVFLVAVFTHAAVVEAEKNSKKDELQEEADKVLLPYKDAIANFTGSELVNAGLAKIPTDGKYSLKILEEGNAEAEWIMESKPEFEMTKNQRVLLSRNIVVIRSNKKQPEILYQNLMEVHSSPCKQEKPESCWLEGALKNTSVELFAETIKLALLDFSKELHDGTNTEKTFSYYLGDEKTFQRGKLALENCDRMVIRTLRGWLLSVPSASREKHENPDCGSMEATPVQAGLK